MGTAYVIYDTETANLIDSFLTEEEALAMIKRAVKEEGPESIEGWALGRTDRTGEVFSGPKLVHRALGG
jgi:hypothetical protein